MALPLLLEKFAPEAHQSVLSAVHVLTMDAAMSQRSVFEEIKSAIFPLAIIRFCYWHEIKKAWAELTPQLPATIKKAAKANVLATLKFIFLSAEARAEQRVAFDHLRYWIEEANTTPTAKQLVTLTSPVAQNLRVREVQQVVSVYWKGLSLLTIGL